MRPRASVRTVPSDVDPVAIGDAGAITPLGGVCAALTVELAALTLAVVLLLTCELELELALDAEVEADVVEVVDDPHATAPRATPARRARRRAAVIMSGLRTFCC